MKLLVAAISFAPSTKPVKIFTDSIAIKATTNIFTAKLNIVPDPAPRNNLKLKFPSATKLAVLFFFAPYFHLTLNFLHFFLKDLLSFSKFAKPTAIAASCQQHRRKTLQTLIFLLFSSKKNLLTSTDSKIF